MKKLGIFLVSMVTIGTMQAVSSGGYNKRCFVSSQKRSKYTYLYTEKVIFHGRRKTRYCYVTIDKNVRQDIIDELYKICQSHVFDPQKTYILNFPFEKTSMVGKVLTDFVQVSQWYTIADVITVLERNNKEELSPSGTVK